MHCRACTASCYQMAVTAIVAGERYTLVCFCWACSVHRLVAGSCSYSWYWPRTYCIVIASTGPCIVIASTGPGPRVVGSSSQQRQLITYHVECTEEEHPQPAPSPEHSLAYRRPTGGGPLAITTIGPGPVPAITTTAYQLPAGWCSSNVLGAADESCLADGRQHMHRTRPAEANK